MSTMKVEPKAPATEPKARVAPPEGEPATAVERRVPAPPAPWEGRPFEFMHRASQEMDQTFERFFEDLGLRWPRLADRLGLLPHEVEAEPAAWLPRVDVLERKGNLVIRVDLPGLTAEDVNVEITDDMLTIKGERRQEAEEEREGYYYTERRYGNFYRAIPLPEGIETARANAEFRDGVLQVAMPTPARPERKPRRLEIHGHK